MGGRYRVGRKIPLRRSPCRSGVVGCGKPVNSDNRPLGGTSIGGSGTVAVVTKGALTNGAAASQANGFFGAYLRFSGIDGIILQVKLKDGSIFISMMTQ